MDSSEKVETYEEEKGVTGFILIFTIMLLLFDPLSIKLLIIPLIYVSVFSIGLYLFMIKSNTVKKNFQK